MWGKCESLEVLDFSDQVVKDSVERACWVAIQGFHLVELPLNQRDGHRTQQIDLRGEIFNFMFHHLQLDRGLYIVCNRYILLDLCPPLRPLTLLRPHLRHRCSSFRSLLLLLFLPLLGLSQLTWVFIHLLLHLVKHGIKLSNTESHLLYAFLKDVVSNSCVLLQFVDTLEQWSQLLGLKSFPSDAFNLFIEF